MLEITKDIDDWLAQRQTPSVIFQEIGIPLNCVVWSDDLAVPWYTSSADDLTSGIESLLAFIHQLFTV